MESSMHEIIAALDVVALEQCQNDIFRLIGSEPDWIKRFCLNGACVKQGPELCENLPYLRNFIVDAESFWMENKAGRLKSGVFIEVDLSGKECALEATAVCLGQRRILLIGLLGADHEERTSLLQKARETILIRDWLEEAVRKRTEDIRRREEEIALRLVWASESRHKETGNHVRRIGLYSETLARAIGWESQKVDDIRVAACMHDIGKIGIPDGILCKPGKLSPQEFEIMKSHTEIGAKILKDSDVPLLQMAREIALCHHERWDGSGYPHGLAAYEIPESGRIVAIADVYDALVHERIYKAAVSEEEAVAIMHKEQGKHFDPEILESFLDLLPSFRRIREDFAGS